MCRFPTIDIWFWQADLRQGSEMNAKISPPSARGPPAQKYSYIYIYIYIAFNNPSYKYAKPRKSDSRLLRETTNASPTDNHRSWWLNPARTAVPFWGQNTRKLTRFESCRPVARLIVDWLCSVALDTALVLAFFCVFFFFSDRGKTQFFFSRAKKCRFYRGSTHTDEQKSGTLRIVCFETRGETFRPCSSPPDMPCSWKSAVFYLRDGLLCVRVCVCVCVCVCFFLWRGRYVCKTNRNTAQGQPGGTTVRGPAEDRVQTLHRDQGGPRAGGLLPRLARQGGGQGLLRPTGAARGPSGGFYSRPPTLVFPGS